MNQSMIKKLTGFRTIKDIQNILKIKRGTAIKYIHLLRKQGLVTTLYKKDRTRIYKITLLPKLNIGNESFYDIINIYSPIKVTSKYNYRVIGRKLTIEEVIIKAIQTKNPKIILASLALFNHVKKWSLLYKLAKRENMARQIGALYELAKRFIKVRKMDKRTSNALMKTKSDKYIINYLKSNDFKDIEKKWNVYLPFNKIDMGGYKEWRLT